MSGTTIALVLFIILFLSSITGLIFLGIKYNEEKKKTEECREEPNSLHYDYKEFKPVSITVSAPTELFPIKFMAFLIKKSDANLDLSNIEETCGKLMKNIISVAVYEKSGSYMIKVPYSDGDIYGDKDLTGKVLFMFVSSKGILTPTSNSGLGEDPSVFEATTVYPQYLTFNFNENSIQK